MGQWKSNYKNITKEEISIDLLKIYSEHKYINRDLYIKYGNYSYKSIVKLYGSFTNSLKENNIAYKRKYKHHNIDKDSILYDIISVYKKIQSISTQIYIKEGKYKLYLVKKEFETFENAIKEANKLLFKKLDIEQLLTLSKVNKSYKNISTKELWLDIIELLNKHNCVNTTLLFNEAKYPASAYLSRLGNISEIYEKLNLIKYRNASISHIGKYCIYLISDILKVKPEHEKTFDWLVYKNKNGYRKKLKIDAYFKEFNLAIEYNGIQHYDHISNFDHKYEKFIIRKERDELKRKKLKEKNIKLIEIKYDEPVEKSYLLERLIEAGVIK